MVVVRDWVCRGSGGGAPGGASTFLSKGGGAQLGVGAWRRRGRGHAKAVSTLRCAIAVPMGELFMGGLATELPQLKFGLGFAYYLEIFGRKF